MLLDRDLIIVDVGCRWGFAEKFTRNTSQFTIYGFDPDARECEKIKGRYSNNKIHLVPVALTERGGKRTLHLTKEPACSSLLKPDPHLTKRYPALHCAEEVGVCEIETTTLDFWAEESGITTIDYIKIDTQGTELDILKGGISILNTVRALEIEVEFNPIYLEQPLFSDVDSFMRKNGFVLWKLANLAHYSDRAEHKNAIYTDLIHYDSRPVTHDVYDGQLYWANAHYIRKDVIEPATFSKTQVLRDKFLFETIGLIDVANRVAGLLQVAS